MTPEQLKKLAEIAGITYTQDFDGVGILFFSEEDAEWLPWMPDEIMDQAMMVAEGMQKNGFNISISNHVEWRAVFYYRDIPGYFESIADTPSEAICAAALATIGG